MGQKIDKLMRDKKVEFEHGPDRFPSSLKKMKNKPVVGQYSSLRKKSGSRERRSDIGSVNKTIEGTPEV